MNEETRAKLEAQLRYFHDLGLGPFYRDRSSAALASRSAGRGSRPEVAAAAKKAASAPDSRSAFLATALPVVQAPSLFESVERVEGDTLERVREDLGECKRCKLHKGRRTVVFGVGNPRAELVFVGEGPGHDEDVQGIPFVGRAGQLLTQMIEAMSLSREAVYICNVVKCRPPENRVPESDEISTCTPFLLRQLAVIQPKVIVCLGNVAAQTLLGTKKSISQYRGQWFDYRGSRMLATYHPAYLLRNPNAKGDVWKDLQKVMAVLDLKPAPRKRP